MLHRCLPLLVLLLASCRTTPPAAATASPPAPPPTGEEAPALIARWERERSLGEGQLVALATQGAQPEVRVRALRALGRMQAPEALAPVLAALRDGAPEVREEAAFAAGQLGLSWDPLPEVERARLTLGLVDAEKEERKLEVWLVQLEALGKLATPAAVEVLGERLGAPVSDVRARAALSLGVAARRGTALPAHLVAPLAALVSAEGAPEPQRYAGAYGLALSRLKEARGPLLACTRDGAAEVRAVCAKGLSEVGTLEEAPRLGELLADEDERVAVEAVRALVRRVPECPTRGRCAPLAALQGLSARAEQLVRGEVAGGALPLLALAQAQVGTAGRPLLLSLRGQLARALRQKGAPEALALARVECRLAAALDRMRAELTEVFTCGAGQLSEPERLVLGLKAQAEAAPGDAAARRARTAGRFLGHPDVRVRSAALGVLSVFPQASEAERVRPLASGGDAIEAASAAAVLAKMKAPGAKEALLALLPRAPNTPDVAQPVAEGLALLGVKESEPALRALLEDGNATVRSAAASALSALTGAQVRPPFRARTTPLPALPSPLPRRLRVRTDSGDIVLRLDGQEAPVTAGNLAALAQKGALKDLTFHRVVPDFVVQGGDPRGTGEGGPGYTLPCEITRRPYRPYTLGMALSGKDTGGSQFFVTTSAQPHLDGRYTAFGEVESGQEVVRRLLEDERILDVEVLP